MLMVAIKLILSSFFSRIGLYRRETFEITTLPKEPDELVHRHRQTDATIRCRYTNAGS